MSEYTQALSGNELKEYLMKRFNHTEAEAIQIMKDHNLS